MIVLRNDDSSNMDLILLNDTSILIKLLNDTIVSRLTYIGVMYNIEYAMAGL